ncbi:hypothetical protein KIW84_063356 [Lathyrus oleraceus]|uniref:Retrovirus-related Pol polyprotein from transposon TNT 1-94 n=1 Tax=Pisum sativum TaxID=3888 RepID=A0A9D4W9L3_PEA|nr:hypothetical protein KIW84_063356 [Pisum sativum]
MYDFLPYVDDEDEMEQPNIEEHITPPASPTPRLDETSSSERTPQLRSITELYEIIGYSDSDWSGNLDDKKSNTGFVFFMGDPAEICVDNKSALALAKNSVFHERSKHINTRYHFIRESIEKKKVKLKYVMSRDQVADIFTKPLNLETFRKLRNMLGVTNQV